jgi:hypothetical protein
VKKMARCLEKCCFVHWWTDIRILQSLQCILLLLTQPSYSRTPVRPTKQAGDVFFKHFERQSYFSPMPGRQECLKPYNINASPLLTLCWYASPTYCPVSKAWVF